MYKCKNCNSIDKFELMFDENYQGNRNFMQKYNIKSNVDMDELLSALAQP